MFCTVAELREMLGHMKSYDIKSFSQISPHWIIVCLCTSLVNTVGFRDVVVSPTVTGTPNLLIDSSRSSKRKH